MTRNTGVPPLALFLLREPPFPFDLQLFAAEDEGRTEEPTEYKKRKAREEGKVAKTPELPAALVLLFGFFLVFIMSRSLFKNATKMMEYYLNLVPDVVNGGENVIYLFKPMLPILLKLMGPVLAVTFVAAFIGNVVQVGFLFSTKPIEPDFSRINPNPVRFLQRSLFSRQALVNLGKSLFKVAAIGAVAYLLVRKDLTALMRTIDMGLLQALSIGLLMTFKLIMVVSGILLFLSIPDYLFQRSEHLESIKMTKQEVKEEQKLLIGDPLLRARIRERQREFARRRMMQEVPKADVVITNPVHFAVALKYDVVQNGRPALHREGAGSRRAEDPLDRRGKRSPRCGEQAACPGALPEGGDRGRGARGPFYGGRRGARVYIQAQGEGSDQRVSALSSQRVEVCHFDSSIATFFRYI